MSIPTRYSKHVQKAIAILSPHIRNYEWGSPQVIPQYFGWETTGEPIAEVWLGAHFQGSSLIDGELPLSTALQTDPVQYLGKTVSEKFHGRIPFLMKFLAAETPLSIQVHPNLAQAQAGFARELSLSIPDDERNYLDPYDKPEQICAISQMWALAGFRFDDDARELCERAGLLHIADEIGKSSSGKVYMQLLKGELTFTFDTLQNEIPTTSEEFLWVRRLLDLYPNDPAVIAPLFMNLVTLEPGQALSVSAGMVHAYLSGFGVEVMGASDNVLRSGLTRKKIDVPELESIISLLPEIPIVQHSIGQNPVHWQSNVNYFQLHKFEAGQARVIGPAIVACIEGSVSLLAENTQVALERGEFAYVIGDVEASLQGSGSAFICTTNLGGE